MIGLRFFCVYHVLLSTNVPIFPVCGFLVCEIKLFLWNFGYYLRWQLRIWVLFLIEVSDAKMRHVTNLYLKLKMSTLLLLKP